MRCSLSPWWSGDAAIQTIQEQENYHQMKGAMYERQDLPHSVAKVGVFSIT